jgi:hypothetical protein
MVSDEPFPGKSDGCSRMAARPRARTICARVPRQRHGEVLRRLTGEDLRELGVASVGHRRRLLDAVAALGSAQPALSSSAAEGPLSKPTGLHAPYRARPKPIRGQRLGSGMLLLRNLWLEPLDLRNGLGLGKPNSPANTLYLRKVSV